MQNRTKKEGRDRDKDKNVPAAQKTLQINQNARILNIMKAFTVSKPTNVDAQRIVTVLENLIAKVKILQYLDNEFMNNLHDKNKRDEYQEDLKLLEDQTLQMLFKEAELEADIKPLLNPENADKTQDETAGQDLGSLTRIASNNLRNLIRLLEVRPDDLNQIKKLRKTAPQEDYNHFVTCLESLKLLMLKKLSTSVEEKKSHKNQIEELREKIAELERTKAQKQNDLDNLKLERDKYSKEKKDELDKLVAELGSIKNDKLSTTKRLEEASDSRSKEGLKAFNEEFAKKETKRKEAEQKFKELVEQNKVKESQAKMMMTKKEDDLREIVEQNYDIIMDQKEKEIQDLINDVQKKEKEKAELLEEKRIIELERQKEKLVIAKIEAKKKEIKEEEERVNQIVSVIQEAWTQYKEGEKKGKKKKKKGKKKN